jgi:hypothetical protein
VGNVTWEDKGEEVLDQVGGSLVEIIGLLRTDGSRTQGSEDVINRLSEVGVGFASRTPLQIIWSGLEFRDVRLMGGLLKDY